MTSIAILVDVPQSAEELRNQAERLLPKVWITASPAYDARLAQGRPRRIRAD